MFPLILMLIFSIPFTVSVDTSEIVIVILSQPEGYHAAHAKLLKNNTIEEALSYDEEPPEIVLTHEEYLHGSWTFIPLIPHLAERYPEVKWVFFCLENTAIRLRELLKILDNFDASEECWVGHALYDDEHTIIHHFADHVKKFAYPNVASGFAMSNVLLQNIANRLRTKAFPVIDFSIDPSYEFATFVFDNGKGVRLTHSPEFCVFASHDCATYPKAFYPCADNISRERVYVAIKTYDGNHGDRIPILIKTWFKYVKNFGFYSNVKDERLPNVFVVPNTSEGHCAKTQAILEHANEVLKSKKIDWLVIADDDTIMSMARLTRLLTCYNPNNILALGERYGYRIIHQSGYEYLTGGAGLVISAPLVEKMVEASNCKCPTATTPDDMFLFGICFNRIGVQITHSPLFHQARPSDYSILHLASQEPVSFHKFWLADPIRIYDQWFFEADSMYESTLKHTEL